MQAYVKNRLSSRRFGLFKLSLKFVHSPYFRDVKMIKTLGLYTPLETVHLFLERLYLALIRENLIRFELVHN